MKASDGWRIGEYGAQNKYKSKKLLIMHCCTRNEMEHYSSYCIIWYCSATS
jgi:hypothetical protein